jgi:hypothetical protein
MGYVSSFLYVMLKKLKSNEKSASRRGTMPDAYVLCLIPKACDLGIYMRMCRDLAAMRTACM